LRQGFFFLVGYNDDLSNQLYLDFNALVNFSYFIYSRNKSGKC